MAIIEFPPIEECDEHGLLAIGGDLEVSSLVLAYRNGIFPWPSDEQLIPWFSPDPRGILEYGDFKISKTLRKLMQKKEYRVTFNENFPEVIEQCVETHSRKGPTWITTYMKNAYIHLHNAGYAFSVEIWDKNNQLDGGLYGVTIGGYICGESMFHHGPNSGKIALVELMNYLHLQNVNWIDTQMITPTTSSFGGKEIDRNTFLAMLKESLTKSSPFTF